MYINVKLNRFFLIKQQRNFKFMFLKMRQGILIMLLMLSSLLFNSSCMRKPQYYPTLDNSFIIVSEDYCMPYMFFDCNFYNDTNDTIVLDRLNFNEYCHYGLEYHSLSKAYLRLTNMDSLELFSEKYQQDISTIVYPNQSLSLRLSLDVFFDENDRKVKYDSISSMIKDIVYYKNDGEEFYRFKKNRDYRYLHIHPQIIEESYCRKSVISYDYIKTME